ncbi:Shedu anti-phage system protein SduA domain-containing protein [Isoptericola sp. NPDC057559]|uniref:Shedu anti-phage system protein SduA domain-containing protein n=1 Tax=Isoptericola sp. NPDC057559 TaxID=3346168 RepID=UPI00368A018C
MSSWDVHGDADEVGDFDLEDRLGAIEPRIDGDELVLTRTSRGDVRPAREMLRFVRSQGLMRIFPTTLSMGDWADQFDRVRELQVESPSWDAADHSFEGERYGLLCANGLPKGFGATYEYGLGLKRDYRGFVDEIEARTACTVIRFVLSGDEGVSDDGVTFCVSLDRFDKFRAAVDRDRSRAQTAVRRVIDAERHNAVADLFGQARVEPRYGRNEVIRAITEEAFTGHVVDAGDRAALVEHATRAAPAAAHENPERFGRLRQSVELVSLEVLIEQFEEGMKGRDSGNESHWQGFFGTNEFALQQILSMPIVVARQQAHVKPADIDGRGSRIADFLCVNTVTRTAFVVEIKTPKTELMDRREYRGKGTAAVYAPHRDLSGAVSQLQSQLASVPRDLAGRLRETPDVELDPWNEVRGAVIVGQVSRLSPEKRESFLRYRAGLSSVSILGYDEVLARLRTLREVLKAPTSDPPRSEVR